MEMKKHTKKNQKPSSPKNATMYVHPTTTATMHLGSTVVANFIAPRFAGQPPRSPIQIAPIIHCGS
ncbi:hypothetical protein SESBI_45102 [Sesbania bispinosa]|nr:hypothetical protein SESBI_45102 [Sesbania bispinosa]